MDECAGRESKQRLLCLMKLLWERTDELHPLNALEIVELLRQGGVECNRKTIYRDIKNLNSFGIEVIHTTIPRGYYLSDRLFEMPELKLLIDSLRSSEFITEKKTSELIAKLKKLTSIYQAEELDDGSAFNRPKSRNERIYYSVYYLHRAIRCGNKVHFSYYRHIIKDGELTAVKTHEFTVSPYALIWNDGKYYLVANYEKYDNLSHYRVDRMREVELLSQHTRPLSEVSDFSDGFDERAYVSRVFGMYAGTDVETVELKCAGESLEHIVERFGLDEPNESDGQDVICSTEGDCGLGEFSFTVKINAVINDGLVSWILAQRGAVRVVSPPKLVERMKSALENMLSAYSEGDED